MKKYKIFLYPKMFYVMFCNMFYATKKILKKFLT